MEEISKGIYRYGEKLKNSSEKPLVLVHPWFREGFHGFCVFDEDMPFHFSKGDYKGNLDRLLISSSDRDLILLEDYRLKETASERIVKKRGSSGLYVVSIMPADPIPYRSSWDAVISAVRDLGNSVDVAGGRVWKHGKMYSGCAGYTYHKLRESGIDVNLVDGCCFV